MDLELSDDQVALRDGIASMLAARVPIERVRAGFDRELFAELANAGVFSLRADGFAWADCAVVFEQLGRACVPGPLVPSLLSGGGRVAGVLDGGWVEHLDTLDLVIVPDRGECAPAHLDAQPSSWPLDPCTPIARVDTAPETTPSTIDWDTWRRAGATLTAALQLGLADRLTEITVAYAKERTQFDRPIGGFQSIKHLCADMLVRSEVARAALYAAAAHLDDANTLPGVDRAIAGAKTLAGDAAIANGKTATQVHGGMGFTWEVDVHLYLKRGMGARHTFRDCRSARRRGRRRAHRRSRVRGKALEVVAPRRVADRGGERLRRVGHHHHAPTWELERDHRLRAATPKAGPTPVASVDAAARTEDAVDVAEVADRAPPGRVGGHRLQVTQRHDDSADPTFDDQHLAFDAVGPGRESVAGSQHENDAEAEQRPPYGVARLAEHEAEHDAAEHHEKDRRDREYDCVVRGREGCSTSEPPGCHGESLLSST